MSSTTRVLPSVLGGGLERATATILETTLARQAREFREREVSLAEQAQALNSFLTIADLTPPNTKLGELPPSAQRRFEEGFGVSAIGLEDLELNPLTLQDAIARRGGELFMSPEGQSMVNPAIRAAAGIESLEEVEDARRLAAVMELESIRSVLQDPELMRHQVMTRAGMDPVQLRIPGEEGQPDRFIDFNDARMADIFAEFMLQREGWSFRLSQAMMEEGSPLIEEIQEAVRESKFSVSSTALRGSVFPTYQAAVEANDASIIRQYLEDPTISEGEKLALQYLTGSIGIGADALIRNSDARLADFLRVASLLEERFGVEEANRLMPSFLERLGPDRFAQISDPLFFGPSVEVGAGAPSGFFGRLFGGNRVAGGAGDAPPPAGAGGARAPEEILLQATMNLLQRGMPREDLVARVGSGMVEAAEQAIEMSGGTIPAPGDQAPPGAGLGLESGRGRPIPEGGIDPETVPEGAHEAVRRLNTLLETLGDRPDRPPDFDQRVERARSEALRAIEIAEEVDIPFLDEAKDGVPAGGIDPNEVPRAARALVNRFNSLIRRIEQSGSNSTLESQRVRILQMIRERIRGNGA